MCTVPDGGCFMRRIAANTTHAGGMTLVEIMIAMSVLAVGIMSVMSALISITSLENANHEELVAINIARQKLAEIQTAPFGAVFSLYGPGSSGGTFTVSQLQNGTGKIIFPVNANGKLDETIVDANLGMPQDLNGNGTSSDTDVSGSYILLPVRIQLQWSSPAGARELKLNTMLTKLK